MGVLDVYTLPDAYKGDTYNGVRFELLDQGEVVNLTGAVISLELKEDKNESTISVLTLSTVVGGLSIPSPLLGVFQIDQQIIDIDAKTYYYDIEITFPDGTVKTYVKGKWTVVQDITN